MWTEQLYNDLLNQWQARIDKTELEKKFQENINTEKERHPQLTEDDLKLRALRLTTLQLKRLSLIPSELFSGFLYSIGGVTDMGTIRYEDAKKWAQENPEKYIREGKLKIIDDEPIPMDDRKTFKNGGINQNYGKPLPRENKFRVIAGVFKKNGDTSYKKFSMTLNGAMAETLILKQFVPCEIRGSLKLDSEEEYRAGSNQLTTIKYLEEVTTMDYKQLILQTGKVSITNLGALREWAIANKENRNMLAIVEADVISLGANPSAKGNYSIALDDETLPAEQAIVGFMSAEIYEQINFGSESRVLAIGRPAVFTDDKGEERLMFSVSGAWASEEYAVPKPKKITKDDLKTDAERIRQKEFS